MPSQRGGPVTGFLISVGAIVVFFGLLAVACGACAKSDSKHGMATVQLISHHRDDGGDGNGNSGGDYEGGKSGDTDQRGDHNCRNFCFYGIPAPTQPGPQPKGFIPPNPGKIPGQISDFVKLVFDFVQAVTKFAI